MREKNKSLPKLMYVWDYDENNGVCTYVVWIDSNLKNTTPIIAVGESDREKFLAGEEFEVSVWTNCKEIESISIERAEELLKEAGHPFKIERK